MKRTLAACLLLAATALPAGADNWPCWRGPSGNGVGQPGDYPVKFSPTRGVLWKVELPGKGSSTPVVWEDSILITCGVGQGKQGSDGVLCFGWDGKLTWQAQLGPQRPGKHRNGSGSCPSVVTDGKRIFAYFKSGTIAALDFGGKVLWKRNLQKEFGQDSLWWDLGTSPVLAGGNVVVAVMHEGDSYVVAMTPETGKTVWKVDRTFRCARESDQSYTTPIVMDQGGKEALVIWGADHLTAQDAATGKRIWTCGGFNPDNKGRWRVIASPSASDGVAVVPYGRGDFLAGVRLDGSGDVTRTHRLWEKKDLGSDVPTPITTDGKVYQLGDTGTLTCLDIQTGKEIWSSKLPRGMGKFYSSPTLAGDRLYAVRETGTVYVTQITPAGLKVLAVNEMKDRIAATPVPIRNKLLLRGMKFLYCLGK